MGAFQVPSGLLRGGVSQVAEAVLAVVGARSGFAVLWWAFCWRPW